MADEHTDTPSTQMLVPTEEAADVRSAPMPDNGLSKSPGLVAIENSTVPGAAGSVINHVQGPQQNPVDPVAAGLDTHNIPITRQENRVITHTGASAAGQRPHTYLDKTGPENPVPQAGPADGSHSTAPADSKNMKAGLPVMNVGERPTSVSGAGGKPSETPAA